MFCNVCKNEWVGTPDDTKCPHCGADLKKNADQHTIPGVIAFLIEKEGADVLLNPEKVMSYISDLVQGNEREKKLVRVGSTNGAFQRIHALLEEPKQSKREVMVIEIRHHLMDFAFLSEENAVQLINILLDGIGMPSLKLQTAVKKEAEPAKKEQKKPAAKPSAVEQKKPAAQPAKPTPKKQSPVNSAPRTAGVNGSDTRRGNVGNGSQNGGAQQQGSRFRLRSISTFEYDGVSFASQKVDGSLFLRGEARMIGILVTYDPVQTGMNVSLDWQIFRQDGSPLTGLIHGLGMIGKGDSDFYQGWGWSVPGNWEPGRYTVRASMSGSNQLTTCFDIVEGRYDNPRFAMNNIRLFSAGAIPPAISDRKYFTSFSTHQARRIYFEIGFAAMNASVYTTLRYKITRETGEIVANYAIPIRLHKGDRVCWTGFGWENPGYWKKGRYFYEATLGTASNIFHGAFDIV